VRPRVKQIFGVYRTQSGGEILAHRRGVGGLTRFCGCRELADDLFPIPKTIVGNAVVLAAGDVDVAPRNVIENAGRIGQVAGGLAGIASGRRPSSTS